MVEEKPVMSLSCSVYEIQTQKILAWITKWRSLWLSPYNLFLDVKLPHMSWTALYLFSDGIGLEAGFRAIFRLKSVTELLGTFWASCWHSQLAQSLGQRTSRRAPSNSAWGRRYDPWRATGLPNFGVEDIVRGRGGGRRVNRMAFRTKKKAENVGFVSILSYIYVLYLSSKKPMNCWRVGLFHIYRPG